MQAIILNSGKGIRMHNLTKTLPKCLLRIQKAETILSRQLKILIHNGINKVIITTGYFEDKLKDYIHDNFSHLNIKYIYNPKYNSTNYIYSLYLVRDIDREDIVLMHGDMVFAEELFQKILVSIKRNTVLVKETKELPEKDFKARINQARIREIGTNIFEKDCFPLFPAYKLTPEFYKLWLVEIEKSITKGDVNIYAESALNRILGQIKLEPVYFNHELCMEIDNSEDLKTARMLLKDEKFGTKKF